MLALAQTHPSKMNNKQDIPLQNINLEQKIKAAETRIFKVVFPNTTNHYDTLFGGLAMYLMDENGYSIIGQNRF